MTFTILASDPTRGLLAAATASRSLAVGAGVPAIRVGVGAAASQAYTNRALRGRLLDALESGETPASALQRIPEWDRESEKRQAAVISSDGEAAAHTGATCSAWAGSELGEGFVVAGNLLPGPEVLSAMSAAFLAEADGVVSTDGDSADDGAGDTDGKGAADAALAAFASRVLAALAAGDAAGGDSRGRQSAALLVGAGERPKTGEAPLAIDLRADDHTAPIAELGRLLELAIAERRAAAE